jgi:hypothetical protein
LTWVSRLNKLHVTTSFNGIHTHAQLDGFDEFADECGSTGLMPVEGLGDEEQGAALAEGFNLPEHPLEEEKDLFEGHILIEKRCAWPQQDD